MTDAVDGRVAQTVTHTDGVAGFAIPADIAPHDLRLAVHAPGFNPRHMRLDGSNIAIDLVELLYPDA